MQGTANDEAKKGRIRTEKEGVSPDGGEFTRVSSMNLSYSKYGLGPSAVDSCRFAYPGLVVEPLL